MLIVLKSEGGARGREGGVKVEAAVVRERDTGVGEIHGGDDKKLEYRKSWVQYGVRPEWYSVALCFDMGFPARFGYGMIITAAGWD